MPVKAIRVKFLDLTIVKVCTVDFYVTGLYGDVTQKTATEPVYSLL